MEDKEGQSSVMPLHCRKHILHVILAVIYVFKSVETALVKKQLSHIIVNWFSGACDPCELIWGCSQNKTS